MYDTSFYSEISAILGPFSVPQGAHERILQAYSEPWRAYHNVDHIMQMLELSRGPGIHLSKDARQRLELMILYHDVWYEVGRPPGENESQSAAWAINDLADGMGDDMIRLRDAVKQGIVATTKHSLDNINPDYVDEIATLLDLDLWRLGQEPDAFQEDTEKIWREHQHIITRDKFDAGRSVWARSFLRSRERIYHTRPFLVREGMARINLERLAD